MGTSARSEEMKRRNRGRKLEPDPSDNESEIMTLHGVADYLNCYWGTVYKLIRRGEFPAFRVGSDYRFRRADIDEWIAAGGSGLGATNADNKVAGKRRYKRKS
jgi:excisionase family DNA binding protein